MSVFFGRLEFLTVGCLFGEVSKDHIYLSSGSSIKESIEKLDSPVEESMKWNVLTTCKKNRVFRHPRLLQNYLRKQASLNCGIANTIFARKGFRSCNPLNIAKNNFSGLASLVLKVAALNNLTEEGEHNNIYTQLKAPALPEHKEDISFSDLNDMHELISALKEKEENKDSAVLKALEELINGHREGQLPQSSVDGTLPTSIYKKYIAGRCNTINQATIKKILLNKFSAPVPSIGCFARTRPTKEKENWLLKNRYVFSNFFFFT